RAGPRAPARPRDAVRPTERRRRRVSGTQGADREVAQATAVQDAGVLALQPLRTPARRLQEVRPLPDLPARARARRRDPRHGGIELVMQTDPIADMLTRIRNANRALHETAQLPSSKLN